MFVPIRGFQDRKAKAFLNDRRGPGLERGYCPKTGALP